MDKSFRTILNERMNQPEAAPAAAFASLDQQKFEAWLGEISWSPRSVAAPARAYADATSRSRESARRASAPRPEPVIASSLLSLADLEDVARLIALGGVELEEGLSKRRLKAAFRRLALRFHPDAGLEHGHENFVDLRARYERLLASVSSV